MTNHTIQGLWIGGELSTMEQLSIKSFLANGHQYHLYIYEEVKNIPPGTIVKDGNEILPQDKIFTYQKGWGKGSYAGFADWFRYHLLHTQGGWWVDTDIVCLKPFDFPSECVIASSYEGKWGETANNCALKLPRNSQLTQYLVQEAEKQDPNQVGFGETGPHLVQKAVRELNYQDHVISYQTFCPITWRAVKKMVYPKEHLTLARSILQIKDLVRPLFKPQTYSGRITRKSYAVHLWNEVWRQNQLDKNKTYDCNCLYERLKLRYM